MGWVIPVGIVLAVPAMVTVVRYPFLGLSLWLLVAPFLMTTETVGGRKVYWIIHRALPPATVAIIAFWARHKIDRRSLSRLGWPELAMATYVLASLVSIVLLHRDPLATAYLFYDRVFSPMCLYMLVRLWNPDEKDLRRLMPVVLFLAASQSLIGILSWIAPQYLPAAWLEKQGARTIGTLVNPSVYTVTLLFSGGILVHAAYARKPGTFRFLFGGTAALAFGCVFLSLSRASWLAGLVVLAGLACCYPRQLARLSVVTLLGVLIVGGLFLPDLSTLASERFLSDQSERSALSRLPVYLAGFRMFLAKPLYGWGYGNFDRYDQQFQGRVAGIADDNKDHASHNFYLTLLAEQGILGFVLFLFPAVCWLLRSRARNFLYVAGGERENRKLLTILWFSIVTHIVVNNFSNMRVPFGLGLWWASLGLIAALITRDGRQGRPGSRDAERFRIRIAYTGPEE